jgi:hypothetical protein
MAKFTHQPGDLYLGSYPLQVRPITVASGAGVLSRGTVLGRVTASGKYITSLAAAETGSQTPVCLLAEDVDATSGDVATVGYFSGDFDSTRMTFGTGHTPATVDAAFAVSGHPIFIKTPV